MKVSHVSPADLGTSEIARWRSLQQASPRYDSPFLCPEFAVALGRCRDDTEVAVLEDGGLVVGFLGYHRSRGRVGLPLGAGLADGSGLVCAEGLHVDVAALLRGCGLRRLEFDHQIVDGSPFTAGHRTVHPSPVIDLSDGFPAYREHLAERSSSLVSGTARQRRVLGRDHGPVSGAWEPDDREALTVLRQWKAAQYQQTGEWDRFARPWITQLLEELATVRTPGFAGSLYTLRAGERLVAVHLGLRTATRLSLWFPTYDAGLAKYSPGTVMLLSLVEEAASRGMTEVELGKGDEAYKQRLGTGHRMVAQGWVATSRSAQAAPRARVAARDLVMRVPPRVRGLPRRLRARRARAASRGART